MRQQTSAGGEYAKGFHEPLSGGSVTSVSGWEEAEGEGRGGGREDEGENEMGGGCHDGRGDATAPVFRTAAGQRSVSHDRAPPRITIQQRKCLVDIVVLGKRDHVKLSAVF